MARCGSCCTGEAEGVTLTAGFDMLWYPDFRGTLSGGGLPC
jgi:hypothetical protein